MAETIERFPLFPLGLVLIPHELVPLHIFEERYKLMIGECLERDREFGIVWLSDDGLKEIGCSARVSKVLERFDDGRLNVLVEGTTPFRLLRRIDDLPYPAGDVEPLDDEQRGAGDDEVIESARRRSVASATPSAPPSARRATAASRASRPQRRQKVRRGAGLAAGPSSSAL